MAEAGVFRPGVAFKNAKLYLFTKRDVTVVKPWPPAAWRKTKTKPWTRCRPKGDVLLSDLPHREASLLETLAEEAPDLLRDVTQGQMFFPWYEFPDSFNRLRSIQQLREQHRQCFAAVPIRVIELIRRFEERRFALMSFAHACGEAGLELLESNSALAFMVATNWIWHKPSVKRPLDAARRLVCMRRRDILHWLQFEIPSEAAVKALAKYPAELLTVESLFYLRDALRYPEVMRTLGFLPRINRGVIRIASDPRLLPHASFRLLKEVALNAEDEDTGMTAYWLGEDLAMMERLARDPRGLCFHSLRRVHEYHQRLSRESIHLAANVRAFPAPPLPGTVDIEPIETPSDLIREAEEQNNCVMSLAPDIAAGRLFVYRMVRPERATLSIAPSGNGWVLTECRGPNNRTVTQGSLAEISRWLAASQGEFS